MFPKLPEVLTMLFDASPARRNILLHKDIDITIHACNGWCARVGHCFCHVNLAAGDDLFGCKSQTAQELCKRWIKCSITVAELQSDCSSIVSCRTGALGLSLSYCGTRAMVLQWLSGHRTALPTPRSEVQLPSTSSTFIKVIVLQSINRMKGGEWGKVEGWQQEKFPK